MSHADFITPSSGLSEFQCGRYDRALPLLRPLAEQGHAEAQCMMGNIYHLGLGGVVPDLPNAIAQSATKSFVWYSRAAAQGYGVASNNLAERISAESVYLPMLSRHGNCMSKLDRRDLFMQSF